MPRRKGRLPQRAGRIRPPALRGGHPGLGLGGRGAAGPPEDASGHHGARRPRAGGRPGPGPFAIASPRPARIPPEVRRRWERTGVTRWDFGDLPETVVSGTGRARRWAAYPALSPAADGVELMLFARRDQAAAAHPKGVAALLALHFAKDLKFLKRSVALPEELHPAARQFGGARRMEDALAERVVQDLFAAPTSAPRRRSRRTPPPARREDSSGRPRPALRGPARAFRPMPRRAGTWPRCPAPRACPRSPAGLEEELSASRAAELHLPLRPPRGWRTSSATCRRLAIRARRAVVDPEKDRAKAEGLQAYTERLNACWKRSDPAILGRKAPRPGGALLDDRGVQGVDLRPGAENRRSRCRPSGWRRRSARSRGWREEGSEIAR